MWSLVEHGRTLVRNSASAVVTPRAETFVPPTAKVSAPIPGRTMKLWAGSSFKGVTTDPDQ